MSKKASKKVSEESGAGEKVTDDSIAYIKGDYTHHKIIPIILRPEVVFPFQVTNMEFRDENWKKVLNKAHEEKTVVGFMYRNEETEDVPAPGRVATAAAVTEIHKAVDGTYLVKFVPINRFFTKEYVELDPVLRAEVSYYWDQPEDDKTLEPLYEWFLMLLNRIGKLTRHPYLADMTMEALLDDIQLLSYTYFRNHPKLTNEEQLYALWMYKLSLRLTWQIDLLEKMITPGFERLAKWNSETKNN
jgi:ATP-dependent Lon protease